MDFSELSADCRRHLKAGRLDLFSCDLKIMGDVLCREGKRTDELKVLMLAFYIDLSGAYQEPFIDKVSMAHIRSTVSQSKLDEHQIRELYMDTARADATPRHAMTVSDSLYLLELCIAGRDAEADAILAGLTK